HVADEGEQAGKQRAPSEGFADHPPHAPSPSCVSRASMSDLFSDPRWFAPLSGLGGAIAVKLFDAWMSRRREGAAAAITDQATFRAELWREINALRAEMKELEGKLDVAEREAAECKGRLAALSAENEQLRDDLRAVKALTRNGGMG